MPTQASKEVVRARKAAEDVAKVFFETKLAEIEAKQSLLVDAGAPPDPKAAKGKPPPPTEKPSDAIAKMLDEVTKAIQEAENAETDSNAAAVLAQKHAEESQASQVEHLTTIPCALQMPCTNQGKRAFHVIFCNRTAIFEWCVVRCRFKIGLQTDMCLEEIGLHAQNISTILGSVVDIIVGGGRPK